MKLAEIVSVLDLQIATGEDKLDRPVNGGYVSDLLSNVMSEAGADSVWITLQGHQNIVAVAALASLAAIVVAGGAPIEPNAVQRAKQEGIILLTTTQPAFTVAGRLYQLIARPG